MTSPDPRAPRVILCHKQSTSARLRFLQFADGHVCGLQPFPPLSQLLDETPEEKLLVHPAATVNAAAEYFGLEGQALEAEGEYQAFVEIPEGPVQVFLAYFTDIDPPFEAAEACGAKFIDLTEARGLSEVELGLLRRAYEVLMGG